MVGVHVDQVHGPPVDEEPDSGSAGKFVLPPVVCPAGVGERGELAFEPMILRGLQVGGLGEEIPRVDDRVVCGGEQILPALAGLSGRETYLVLGLLTRSGDSRRLLVHALRGSATGSGTSSHSRFSSRVYPSAMAWAVECHALRVISSRSKRDMAAQARATSTIS